MNFERNNPYPIIEISGFPKRIVTLQSPLAWGRRTAAGVTHGIKRSALSFKLVTKYQLHGPSIHGRGFGMEFLRGILVDEGEDGLTNLTGGVNAAHIEGTIVGHGLV